MAPTSNWNNYYFNYADYFRNDFKMKAQSDDASNIKKVQWQTLVNIDISSLPEQVPTFLTESQGRKLSKTYLY